MVRTEHSVARGDQERDGREDSAAAPEAREGSETVGNAESQRAIMQMSSQIELVTPETAVAWLEHAADNRKFSQGHCDRLGRAMDDGEWRVSSQGVGLDYRGRCMDGQHRLWAIVQTGVSVWLVVVRGLDPDAIRAIDDTRKRTLNDDFRIEGRDNTGDLAAFANLTLRFQRAARRSRPLSSVSTMQLNRIEGAKALEEYERLEDVGHIVKLGHRSRRYTGMPASALNAAYYLALRKHEDSPERAVVDEFFEKFTAGHNIAPGDPVGALLHSVSRIKKRDGKLQPVEGVAALLYCLQKTIAGEQTSTLQWSAIRRRDPEGLLL